MFLVCKEINLILFITNITSELHLHDQSVPTKEDLLLIKDLECLCHIHNLVLVKYISQLPTFGILIGILYKSVSGYSHNSTICI